MRRLGYVGHNDRERCAMTDKVTFTLDGAEVMPKRA